MENKRIVYENGTGGICIFTPFAGCGLALSEIAPRVVPLGIPYKIIEASGFPADRTLRAAWTIDPSAMETPDGYGSYVPPVDNDGGMPS